MTNYREWLEGHKDTSRARGGRPINPPSRVDEGYFHRAEREGWSHIRNYRGWKRGEIVNPTTGEVVTNCLTISKLAEKLSTTSHKVIDLMETQGFVNRVLSVESVPMICAPDFRKPQYSHRPVVTTEAVEDGYCIPITVNRSVGFEERRIKMILITPDGQRLIASRMVGNRKHNKAGQVIKHLVREGKSQVEITALTGFSKQQVSYHVRKITSTSYISDH